jgi:hypothetical protein
MFITNFITLLFVTAAVQAFHFSDVYSPSDIMNLPRTTRSKRLVLPASCPAVWTEISEVLTKKFLDTASGQCNDDARAAIRAAFHDCGSWNNKQSSGGCDGSLFLAGEYNRQENNGLQSISKYLGGLAAQHKVGVADMIQFAACEFIFL